MTWIQWLINPWNMIFNETSIIVYILWHCTNIVYIHLDKIKLSYLYNDIKYESILSFTNDYKQCWLLVCIITKDETDLLIPLSLILYFFFSIKTFLPYLQQMMNIIAFHIYLIKIRCVLYFYDILIVDNPFFNMWYKSKNLMKCIRHLPAITLVGW